MTKNVLYILMTIILYSCEFTSDLKELHKELVSLKLYTNTMAPNNDSGTIYSIDYKNKKPKRFEIVEFRYADEYYDKDDFYSSDQHVSRVIGMPREIIEIKEGIVYINDKVLVEPFLIDSCRSRESYPKTQIKDNHYFVMVDYRKIVYQDSIKNVQDKPYDSRTINPVHESKIVGVTNLK